MRKTDSHVHRLKRTKYANGTKVYFCVLNCAFKIEVPFALGRKVICWLCGEEFVMNEYSIKLAKPHCTSCGKHQVTDTNGNKRFISKARPAQAIADLNKSTAASLRDRLSRVVAMAQDEEL